MQRARRHKKIRATIQGTADRPRMNVFKSNKEIYIQLIDDLSGKTIVSAHSKELKKSKGKLSGKTTKSDLAFELGKLIAEKALKKDITYVVFDRGGYKFHGRIKAVADGARENGLKF